MSYGSEHNAYLEYEFVCVFFISLYPDIYIYILFIDYSVENLWNENKLAHMIGQTQEQTPLVYWL